MFDRFVIGVSILLVIIAGCAIEDWMRAGATISRLALLSVCGVCGLLRCRRYSLDVVIATDSACDWTRYDCARAPETPTSHLVGPES